MPIKRADLHLHTRFSLWKHFRMMNPRDSYTDPFDAWQSCKKAGMDFVAFTDHDTIDGALDLLSRRPDLEPEIIIGEEVETRFPDTNQWIHVNVFDIDESIHRDLDHLKGNAVDLVGYLRQRGIFHVLNHPFQSYYLQQPALDYIDRVLDLFEFFEIGNASQSSRHNRAVAEMLDYASAGGRGPRHGVGGSDAHNLRDIGLFCTEAAVDDEAAGKRQWLETVARGEGRAVGRSIGTLGLTANVWRTVGHYYLSFRESEMRSRMSAMNYVAAGALAPFCLAGLPVFLNLGNSLRLEAVIVYLRRALNRRLREATAAEIPAREFLQDSPD